MTGAGLSLLVPFREDSSGTRTRTWRWLEQFWATTLPEAEVIIGEDDGMPYSKAVAINEAAARATGDIFVILDADTFIAAEVIQRCADHIRAARAPVWFLPHTVAYRLTREYSNELLAQDPKTVRWPDGKLRDDQQEDNLPKAPGFVQVMSRHAWTKVGGMDPRFRGWGGEDSSFIRAVGTLYGKHHRTGNKVLHLWHERPGAGSSRSRTWDGQTTRNRGLAGEYRRAEGDKHDMRVLVDEGLGRTT